MGTTHLQPPPGPRITRPAPPLDPRRQLSRHGAGGTCPLPRGQDWPTRATLPGTASTRPRGLPLDPIATDEAGAPYLRFFNHKASKEAVIPISDRVREQIRRQQEELRDRYGTAPRFLLPAIRKNPDGQRAMSWSTLNRRLQRWLEEGDVRDAAGKPVKITAHQFRHTVGTRMIDNEVPLDIV